MRDERFLRGLDTKPVRGLHPGVALPMVMSRRYVDPSCGQVRLAVTVEWRLRAEADEESDIHGKPAHACLCNSVALGRMLFYHHRSQPLCLSIVSHIECVPTSKDSPFPVSLALCMHACVNNTYGRVTYHTSIFLRLGEYLWQQTLVVAARLGTHAA